MTRVVWNAVSERVFEAGVDRGMLYIDDDAGVPWNGLTSVAESPSGGDVQPYYIDGIKYLNVTADEEFAATIEAYTYPEEFEQCDGTAVVDNGLFATQQPKKAFSFCYRTLVGNDVSGIDKGYKIHVVYNASAAPTERANSTMSDSIDPFNFSWAIVTLPPDFVGFKPTSHFMIDSRRTPPDLLSQIEDILYGSSSDDPRIPSVGELLYLFTSFGTDDYDAGGILEPVYATIDGGPPLPDQSSIIDGGTP